MVVVTRSPHSITHRGGWLVRPSPRETYFVNLCGPKSGFHCGKTSRSERKIIALAQNLSEREPPRKAEYGMEPGWNVLEWGGFRQKPAQRVALRRWLEHKRRANLGQHRIPDKLSFFHTECCVSQALRRRGWGMKFALSSLLCFAWRVHGRFKGLIKSN